MKTKILLTAIATMTMTSLLMASGGTNASGGPGNSIGNQQVIVNNYYFDNGYEYASRINRFHNSFVTFDFYSPLFTETYWYHYTPYTWGVSIYDDWYYYGAGVSRYNWLSGFGGSYWWGYDPWWDYNPWMGYVWNSWYAPGSGYSVNYYLGRPYYHYPGSWSRWDLPHWYGNGADYYSDNDHHESVHIDNNYYNHTDYNTTTNYNPSHPYDHARRSASAVIDRRSSVPQSAPSQDDAGGAQTGTDKEKSNNGLRMGQVRRGEVVEPSGTKPNPPVRTNNPNVYDRTDPGRENSNAARSGEKKTQGQSSGTPQSQGKTTDGSSTRTNSGKQTQTNAGGTPSETPGRQQTQSNVKTTRQKSTDKVSEVSNETTTTKSETRRKAPSSDIK